MRFFLITICLISLCVTNLSAHVVPTSPDPARRAPVKTKTPIVENNYKWNENVLMDTLTNTGIFKVTEQSDATEKNPSGPDYSFSLFFIYIGALVALLAILPIWVSWIFFGAAGFLLLFFLYLLVKGRYKGMLKKPTENEMTHTTEQEKKSFEFTMLVLTLIQLTVIGFLILLNFTVFRVGLGIIALGLILFLIQLVKRILRKRKKN